MEILLPYAPSITAIEPLNPARNIFKLYENFNFNQKILINFVMIIYIDNYRQIVETKYGGLLACRVVLILELP
jgi:hypothetical protein